MKLYVANCTKQNYELHYRITETPAPRMQRVQAGGQMLVAGDLSPPQVDEIIVQLRHYGAVDAKDIDRSKDFVGLAFSVDKPIKADVIGRALEHNDVVLLKKGQDTRRTVAVAINQSIERNLQESQMPETLGELEVTADELDSRGKPVSGGVRESVVVNKGAPEKMQTGTQRIKPSRAQARA